MATETTTAPAPARPLYLRLWAGAPKELLYLLIAFPIAAAVFGVSIGLFSAAAGTIATFFIGVGFLIVALYVARGAGTLELILLKWVGRPAIRHPDWRDRTARTGFLGWLRALFGNAHYWLYLVWAGLANFVVSTVSFSIAITWFATALGGLTGWIWMWAIPRGDRDFFVSHWVAERLGIRGDFDPALVDTVWWFIVGLILAATLPFVTRGLTWMSAQPAVYQRLFRIVETVGAKTLTQTDRYQDDRAAAPFAANIVAPQGARLRRGVSVGAVILIVAAAVIWGWSFVADLVSTFSGG